MPAIMMIFILQQEKEAEEQIETG
jgi:hypothetical protein